MTSETFGTATATARKGRQPLTLDGKALSPKAWVRLELTGDIAEKYADFKAAETALRDMFLHGLRAKHKLAAKYGLMLSMKGDKPSYVVCDKAAAGATEAFAI